MPESNKGLSGKCGFPLDRGFLCATSVRREIGQAAGVGDGKSEQVEDGRFGHVRFSLRFGAVICMPRSTERTKGKLLKKPLWLRFVPEHSGECARAILPGGLSIDNRAHSRK
jgi:hypothetical protein